jgi:hypothetical protein
MATKVSPAAAAPETQASTSLDEIAKRPDTITLFANALQFLDEYTIHARNGYRIHTGVSPYLYPESGMITALLELGDPLPLTVQRAKETIFREQREEHQRFEKRVKEEAARIVAAQVQADQDARIAAAEAVANAAVEKIRADVAAERARIEAL